MKSYETACLDKALSKKDKQLMDLVIADLSRAKKGRNPAYNGVLPEHPVPLIITGRKIPNSQIDGIIELRWTIVLFLGSLHFFRRINTYWLPVI